MTQSVEPIAPGPGQESVWDYPRPPRLEPSARHIRVYFDGQLLADTYRAVRVLETSHPPVYYLPPEDVQRQFLRLAAATSVCEYKGLAHYYDALSTARLALRAVWCYAALRPAYAALRDHLAFYPALMDSCWVDDEQVTPQPGRLYGGWITSDIVGPFKGGPGSAGW